MSYQIKLDRKSRKTARFVTLLQKKIQEAFTKTGMSQQQVAIKLGVDRSVVNRRLKDSSNLTLRSIAEFAFAFDKDIAFDFIDPKIRIGSNAPKSGGQEKFQPQKTFVNSSHLVSSSELRIESTSV